MSNNQGNRFQILNTVPSSSTPPGVSSMDVVNQSDSIHSPFFIQSGDHPGLTLVSHILTGSNYYSWCRAMKVALSAKNKLGFVDGTIPQPPETEVSFQVWFRCNSMVVSWIINSVHKEIIESLLSLDTARAIWQDLRHRFHQSNGLRIFQLK